MQKAERGLWSGRFFGIALSGMLAIALAGCGDDESGASGVGSTTSSTGTSSSVPPQTVADTGPGTSTTTTGGSSSTTTGGGSSTTTPPPSTPASSSGVTLGWVAPTQNSNGTPISGLAGYKIHYGTASENYTQVVSLDNPSLSRYVLDSLPSGTYYFAITAYNAQGIESPLSGEISATLN